MDKIREQQPQPSHSKAEPEEADGSSHRLVVAVAQELLQGFLVLLQQQKYHGKDYILSMDLYEVFERFTDMDLPSGFEKEFGRQISKGCLEGRLPFRRTIKRKARLAAYQGVDAVAVGSMVG